MNSSKFNTYVEIYIYLIINEIEIFGEKNRKKKEKKIFFCVKSF